MSFAIFWDSKMTFHRLIEDVACPCEGVTPLLLSAPFYRGTYSGVIIPTGFGNTSYSKLLPALRACSERIEEYLEKGGKLLVFGAADASPNRYDWLPVNIKYHYEFGEHCLAVDSSSPWSCIFDGYDTTSFATDGWFETYEGKSIATAENGHPVLVECTVGKGTLLLASTHEYPSDAFLKTFSKGDSVSF